MSDQLPRRRPLSVPAPGERPRRTGSASLPPRVVARLSCQAGPAAGQEFELTGDEMVLGRANDADISIPDTSVSRKHVRFRQMADGWAVQDLGSGNGTLLNGEPVQEETPLRPGDSIVVGDTELNFVDPEQGTDRRSVPVRRHSGEVPVRRRGSSLSRMRAVDPEEAERRKKRNSRLVILALAVAVLGIGAKVWLEVVKRRDSARLATVEAQRQKVGVTLESVKGLILAGKYKAAKAKLEEIQPEIAQSPEETQGFVKMYLESCDRELPNEALRDEAQAALEKNQPGAAKVALSKIPKNSLQMNLVADLERQVQKKLSARMNDAREAMNASKFDEVVAITTDLLLAQPDDRDATKLSEDAKAALEKPNKPVAVKQQEGGSKPWDSSLERYRDGDLSGALALANECAAKKVGKCRELVRDMSELGELNKKAESLDEKKLQRLSQLDREINGGKPSKVTAAASSRLSNLHYKRASAAKAAGDWGKASEFAKKALQADPDHGPARAMMNEMRAKAKEVYILAYTLKESEPEQALEKLHQVIDMTASDDEWNVKAKALVEKISR